MKKDRSQERPSGHEDPKPSDTPPESASPSNVNPKPGAFDPSRYRLSQDFAAATGVSEVVTTVDVRRPRNQEWFQAHPDPAWSMSVAVLVAEQEKETFLVDPDILPSVRDEVVPKILVACMTREGQPIIWPIKLPDSLGRLDTWNLSALAACEVAKTKWTRLASDQAHGRYRTQVARTDQSAPSWPLSFPQLLEIAFQGREINDLNHPVLRRLRGEF
jgi:hypothetical protein